MESPFKKIMVYDLETGGLRSSDNALTEIAMVAIDLSNLEIVEEQSWLIKPYDSELVYDQEALDVTHLSLDRLNKEGLEKSEVLKNIVDMFGRHTHGNSKPILAGHNIEKFDNKFLFKFFADSKMDAEKYFNKDFMIDTLKWVRIKWFEAPGYDLGTSCNAAGGTLKQAHRALPDTLANAKLLITLLKGLRGEGVQQTKYERRKFNFSF